MKSSSLLASTNHLVKINMSLKIFVHLDTLMDLIDNELPLLALFLLEILMLNYQNGTIMILPIQMVAHLILSHYQQDIKKLSTNYIFILHTIHFLALISNFVIIWIWFQTMELNFHYLKNVIIVSFFGKLTFAFPFPWVMFLKFEIIEMLMLRVYKNLFRLLIG